MKPRVGMDYTILSLDFNKKLVWDGIFFYPSDAWLQKNPLWLPSMQDAVTRILATIISAMGQQAGGYVAVPAMMQMQGMMLKAVRIWKNILKIYRYSGII